MITAESGIYKIKNMITGDFYIGSAVNISKRWSRHRCSLCANLHANAHLQNAWNKYCMENFEFSVLENCEKELLVEREQYYIDNENPSYNICKVAGNVFGRTVSDVTRAKISKGNMYKHVSEETRTKISVANTGKRRSEESCAKMSAAHIGKPNGCLGKHRTEETRAKLSEANKGKPSGMLGKHLSEETRTKMSESQKKRWALNRETKISIRIPYD